jgi:hypothetical protein
LNNEIAIANTLHLHKEPLTRGAPILISTPNLPRQTEIIDQLTQCFVEIERFLKSATSELHIDRTAYFPWGEDSPRMKGEKYVTRGASLDVERYFQGDLLDKHALREKLHLRKPSFEWLPKALSPHLFSFLENFFSDVIQHMDSFEQEYLKTSFGINYDYQLLLIRYGQHSTSYDPELHRLGSSTFGNIHEDETLFSFHLAESARELKVFDYAQQNWTKALSSDFNVQLLLGQHARSYGYYPTPHQLEASGNAIDRERFSFIMERVPNGNSLPANQLARPEFIRFISPSVREKWTAIVVWDHFFDGSPAPKEAIELTEDLVRLHLYFFIKGDLRKIVKFDSSRNVFSELEQMGFKYALCLRPGFLVKCENVAEELLRLAMINTEKYFIHHYHRELRQGASLCLLGNGRGSTIDRWIKNHGINSALFELPNDHVDNLSTKIFSQNLLLEEKPRSEWQGLILKERQGIEHHLKGGFSSTFLFNTEGYQDITGLMVNEKSLHAIGFASGFKLNYLCQSQKQKISQVTYVDSNANSLQLKKDLILTWDGTDFPSWFKKYWQNRFSVYEKDPEFLRNRWERELTLWGGEHNFREHWSWFRSLKISFMEIDIINDVEQLIKTLDSKEPIAFWASNLWHNEFVSYTYGEHKLGEAYLRWLTKFDRAFEKAYFIQDDVPHKGEWISPNNRTARQILKDPVII